jgi:hypothetical protein
MAPPSLDELRADKVLSAEHTKAVQAALGHIEGVLAAHAARSKKKSKKKPNLAPYKPSGHIFDPPPNQGGPSMKKGRSARPDWMRRGYTLAEARAGRAARRGKAEQLFPRGGVRR